MGTFCEIEAISPRLTPSDFGKPLNLFQVKECDTGGPRAGAGPFDLPAQGSNPTQILQVMYCRGGIPDVQLVT